MADKKINGSIEIAENSLTFSKTPNGSVDSYDTIWFTNTFNDPKLTLKAGNTDSFEISVGQIKRANPGGTFTLTVPQKTDTLATLGDIQTISGGENYVQTGSSSSSITQSIYGDKIFMSGLEARNNTYPNGFTAPANNLTNPTSAAIGLYGISIACSNASNDKQYSFPNKTGTFALLDDVSPKENASNKVTSLSSSSTDTQYPSAKCVYDMIGDIETTLATIIGN